MQKMDCQADGARSAILQDYLDHLLSSYQYLDFRGIASLDRVISNFDENIGVWLGWVIFEIADKSRGSLIGGVPPPAIPLRH